MIRDGDKGSRHHEGQHPVGTVLGEPSADGGKEHTPGGYRTPEDRQGQGGEGCARSESLRHVERCPVAVHRFANTIEQDKGGEDPETRGQRRLARLDLWRLIARRFEAAGAG